MFAKFFLKMVEQIFFFGFLKIYFVSFDFFYFFLIFSQNNQHWKIAKNNRKHLASDYPQPIYLTRLPSFNNLLKAFTSEWVAPPHLNTILQLDSPIMAQNIVGQNFQETDIKEGSYILRSK